MLRDSILKAHLENQSYTKIQLDTGVEYLNMLGILRIDDMEEFYV